MTTIVLLLVASLDVVQAAFCVYLAASCIISAVLVWTKDSRNAFGLSLYLPVYHFMVLLCSIWDCEPLFFVLKLALINTLWYGNLLMRISGARLVSALEDKPKSRLRVTIVQLLIGASLVLAASLHLAYPEHEIILFAEMALWGCFLVDLLWHFGIWKTTMKRVFRGVKGMHKILSMNAGLKMIEGVRRRQSIITIVGTLFTEIVLCVGMILANPALDLLLQDKKRNECKQRNSVGSHRFSAFLCPAILAVQISFLVTIYSHAVKKKRDEKLRVCEEERRQVVQVSSLISSQS